MRAATNDPETCIWDLGQNQRPNFFAEELYAVNIGFPIHRTGEHNQRLRGLSLRIVSIEAQVHTSWNDADVRGIDHAFHRFPVRSGDGNYVVKPANLGRFKETHLGVFDLRDHAVDPTDLQVRLPPPKNRFYIVLKECGGNQQIFGEVQRAGKKVAHRNIEASLKDPLRQQPANPAVCELAYRIGCSPKQTAAIVQITLEGC